MTKEEMLETLMPLATGADEATLRTVLETAWSSGKSDGYRETRAMLAGPVQGDPAQEKKA